MQTVMMKLIIVMTASKSLLNLPLGLQVLHVQQRSSRVADCKTAQ